MFVRGLRFVFLSSVLFIASAFGQKQPELAPVPPDTFELVNGATQVPGTAQERARVLDLLERARQNGDVHAAGSQAFTLKVSFQASGNVLFTGAGDMEETWLSPAAFRWTARLGDFSLTRIYADGRLYDDAAVDFIPMRVHMLRDAVFWPINFNQAHALVRTAKAEWKGKELTCILTSGEMAEATPTPGRRWIEREYCIDPSTGLLQVLSDAPGIYVIYDYSNALKFHGRTLPRHFSIVEAGNSVLEARLESITEPSADPNLLKPATEMNAHGPLLSGTQRFARFVRVAPGASLVQPVIVHAILNRDGRVMDAELVGNTDPDLGQSALDIVKRSQYPPENTRAGRQQREAFINVRFVSQ